MAKSKRTDNDNTYSSRVGSLVEESERQGLRILVLDLQLGDDLVTAWSSSGKILKTNKVTQVDECEGNWRTHIHVNRKNCYDTRQYVWIK